MITPDYLYLNVLPLANWKHAKGYKTRIVRLSEITAGSADLAMTLTNYIRNAYATWTPRPRFILLVGDSQLLPPHYRSFHASDGTLIASDLYYALKDEVDFMPDMAVGRVPAGMPASCDSMVQKIMTVEKNPDPTQRYYQTVLTAGYFQDEPPEAGEASHDGREARPFIETAEAARDFFAISEGITVQTAYVCEPGTPTPHFYNRYCLLHESQQAPVPYGGSQSFLTSAQAASRITSEVNAGVWLVTYTGHGSASGWDSIPYTIAQVAALTNGARYPVVFSGGCNTGWFDRASYCFAETWLNHPVGGSHAVVAATRETWSEYEDWFKHGLFHSWYKAAGIDYFQSLYQCNGVPPPGTYNYILVQAPLIPDPSWHMGEAVKYAMELMDWQMYGRPVDERRTMVETLILFGDPEQMPRTTGAPLTLAVLHPAELISGEQKVFDVSVTWAGTW